MLYVFEDRNALDLEPLALTWATFELRCGARTHLERIQQVASDEPISLIVRPEMIDVVRERHPDLAVNPTEFEGGIWLNGAVLWDETAITDLKKREGFIAANEMILGGNLTAAQAEVFFMHLQSGSDIGEAPAAVEGPKLLRYMWDHYLTSGEQVTADFDFWYKEQAATSFEQGVHVIGDAGVFIGEGTKIDPTVVLDTRHGPIIIENNVQVLSHSVIAGPTYIGPKCRIWPFAFLEEAILGPVCRVMGQLEACILHGYTNKQHDGFLGHAYLGSWVNLGAGTTNSDLKNNYGSVKMTVNSRKVDTGETFVGLAMGDHAKSAIGTLFYTGTRVGVAANVFGDVIPPKMVPSFAWGGDGKTRYELEKCLETMAVVKSRRGEIFTDAEKELFSRLYHQDV
jgi:UDP-N-acetylglucosamine diphosphorylase/glucosamine-1-phosphate N-acetyltransferase